MDNVFLIILVRGSVNVMSRLRCHRCGCVLGEGSLKYEVTVSVRSMFDGTITDETSDLGNAGMDRLISEAATRGEEELNREVYEDDVFVMCVKCKEAFLQDIYSHLHHQATPEHGRAHLLH